MSSACRRICCSPPHQQWQQPYPRCKYHHPLPGKLAHSLHPQRFRTPQSEFLIRQTTICKNPHGENCLPLSRRNHGGDKNVQGLSVMPSHIASAPREPAIKPMPFLFKVFLKVLRNMRANGRDNHENPSFDISLTESFSLGLLTSRFRDIVSRPSEDTDRARESGFLVIQHAHSHVLEVDV